MLLFLAFVTPSNTEIVKRWNLLAGFLLLRKKLGPGPAEEARG